MNFKQLRKKKGFTQAALARAVGVSKNSLINWEDGTSFPSPENAERLDELLGKEWRGATTHEDKAV
jgi:transcriptional regulator with XRE-family HTH domain